LELFDRTKEEEEEEFENFAFVVESSGIDGISGSS
jgi:hypothetical protein